MTTDTHPVSTPMALFAFARLCVGAFAAWLAIAAVITFIFEPVPDALVVGGRTHMADLLAGSDTRIVDVKPGYMLVRGMEKGFVRALYSNGAWLVLPATPGGCLDLEALRK
jgi:hypothetical protein